MNDERLNCYREMEEEVIKINPERQVSMKYKILELNAIMEVKSTLYDIYKGMLCKNPGSEEYYAIKNKLEFAIELPHDRMKLPEIRANSNPETGMEEYCDKIYDKLDERIFGLQSVKEKLVEIINNQIYNPKSKSLVAFLGEPGVGKTFTPSILADILGLPFDHISLGGLGDTSVIKGSENVWVGANPGIILRILRKMKYSNGIVLLDEIDKVDKKIQDYLLSIIDYTQNEKVEDLYLSEYKHNLSNIWFMATMNSTENIDPALLDRLNVIRIPQYTLSEKEKIIEHFILPKVCKDLGVGKYDLEMTRESCELLLSMMGKGAKIKGLRSSENEIRDMVPKINLLRTFKSEKSREKLSYHLKDFDGFPYTISSYTVNSLMQKKYHIDISPMIDRMYC